LDTLKTRIQSKDYRKRFVNASTNTVNKPVLFRGLYQGVGSVILATLPSCMLQSINDQIIKCLSNDSPAGAFFLTYESTKSLLTPLSTHLPTPLLHATASSVAELVSCAILTPVEVIKQNAQMMSSASRTHATLETMRRFRSQPSSLFNGYVALAARNLPFTALQFPLFEAARDAIHRWRDIPPDEASLRARAVITGMSAGLAGSFAAVVTTPIDVVKTRIMLAADGSGSSGEIRVLRDIWREQGFRGLWRGGALRAVWTMVGSGLYLGMYDLGRVYLGRRRGVEVEDLT
jgi:solute carrier family 25 (mitochondrial S-adenosylmethionine transporter), member 26